MAGQFTGSSKRVRAHSKSSNLVVNSGALPRDFPVFTGFFEIIRVVLLKPLVVLVNWAFKAYIDSKNKVYIL